MDVTVSVLLIVFFAPLMLVVAIAIMLFDPGPMIFAHPRVGRNGEEFRCYRFRTMRDGKLTPVGAILRMTSLDELPQFFNVLRGEMSLVGPQPIAPADVQRYGRFVEAYFSVKPGLTGLWRVTGSSGLSHRRRVATDVFYARSRTPGFDAKILLATIPAMLDLSGET